MSREAMKLALKGLERSESELHKARAALKQALEQPEPETVECHTCKGLGRIYMGCGSWIHCDTCNTTGKATTPPKREPLTDEQIATISVECATVSPSDIYFARAIEAAHGIKEEA